MLNEVPFLLKMRISLAIFLEDEKIRKDSISIVDMVDIYYRINE